MVEGLVLCRSTKWQLLMEGRPAKWKRRYIGEHRGWRVYTSSWWYRVFDGATTRNSAYGRTISRLSDCDRHRDAHVKTGNAIARDRGARHDGLVRTAWCI